MSRLKFGVEIFPYHPPTQNPTTQFEEDLELVAHLDRLGYDEVWFGEHHSTGWENIASPELMALAAAERTKHVRLGLGVTSIPYHHPLMLADRIIQLDHLTRGRVIWGMGTGSVAQDADMMGLDTQQLRRMTEEGVEAILALLRYDGPVTRKTDWFELRDAALQLRPYSDELDIRVAGMLSPSGPRLAGRHGVGLFQFGATGEGMLENTWKVLQASATEHGTTVGRDRWSVLHHLYVAETEEEARADAKWGLEAVVEMLSTIVPMFETKPSSFDGLVDAINEGAMVIGTPQMAIDRIEQIIRQSGGVGTFIIGNNECASPENMRKSFSLIARHVFPHFNGQAQTRLDAVRRAAAFGRNASGLAAAQSKAGADWEAHQRTLPTDP